MERAIELALEAYRAAEIPVGCVIVKNGRIIGEGMNYAEREKNPTRHAEICAVERACRTIGSKFLCECQMYVTLEPCPMCAGAILNARIPEVYFGATDQRMGACGSVINLFYENFGYKPKVTGGILSDRCSDILTEFFREMRKNK